MAKAQQAFTYTAIVVLCAIALIGAICYAYGINPEAGKVMLYLTIPTVGAIAGNAIQQSREKTEITQPKGWKGVLVFVTGEEEETIRKIANKLASG